MFIVGVVPTLKKLDAMLGELEQDNDGAPGPSNALLKDTVVYNSFFLCVSQLLKALDDVLLGEDASAGQSAKPFSLFAKQGSSSDEQNGSEELLVFYDTLAASMARSLDKKTEQQQSFFLVEISESLGALRKALVDRDPKVHQQLITRIDEIMGVHQLNDPESAGLGLSEVEAGSSAMVVA